MRPQSTAVTFATAKRPATTELTAKTVEDKKQASCILLTGREDLVFSFLGYVDFRPSKTLNGIHGLAARSLLSPMVRSQ